MYGGARAAPPLTVAPRSDVGRLEATVGGVAARQGRGRGGALCEQAGSCIKRGRRARMRHAQ